MLKRGDVWRRKRVGVYDMDICTARQAAKQAERQREKRAYLNGLLRKRLSKLNEARYHSMFAPDNDDGRAMLTALMRFGLSAESAAIRAPWLEPDELTRLQRAARRLHWGQIGARIKLTEQERITHRLWQFRPHDVAWEEVQKHDGQRRIEKDRERQRKKRQEQQECLNMMQTTNRREEAILSMLVYACTFHRRSMSVSELVTMAPYSRAFRRPDGYPLRNLRDAVHVTLDALEQQGMVETEQRAGARGQVRWVCLSLAVTRADQNGKRRTASEVAEYLRLLERDTFSDGRSVGDQKQAKLTSLQ